jgi:hypothetical protein
MVLPDSHGIPRAPWYLGTLRGRYIPFIYRTFTFFGPSFQRGSIRDIFCNFPAARHCGLTASRYPVLPTHDGFQQNRFRLLPVRSPLLGQSLLLSFPEGTGMFRFPSLPSLTYGFSQEYPANWMSYLIRKSPDHGVFATPRGLSQLTTSFISYQCQGIPCVLLLS